MTILLVSHDIEFCAKHATRCALLFDGAIVAEDAPRAFFAGSSFYTTAANRMARGLLPEAVTVEDLIAACGGAIPPEMEPKDWDGAPLDAVEAQARPKRPLWKRITAGLSLLGAVGLAISSLGNSSLSELVTAEGLGAGAPGMLGRYAGMLALLVLFAALTSSIALTESAVSTFEDELGWDRTRSTILIGCIMITLGSLSALGYGPLASVTVFGMQFLDFFDFLTNSVMMPIAAIATCLLVSRIVGVEKIEEEVTREGQPFRRKPVFNFMLRYLCPIFAAIILASSVANALGWIAM